MDAETRHTLAVTDPRAFVRHPLLLAVPFAVVVVLVAVVVVFVVFSRSRFSRGNRTSARFPSRSFASSSPPRLSAPFEPRGRNVGLSGAQFVEFRFGASTMILENSSGPAFREWFGQRIKLCFIVVSMHRSGQENRSSMVHNTYVTDYA